MAERFRAGFDGGTKCSWTDNFPAGCLPITDNHSVFAFGTCVAIAPDKSSADMIVKALNFAYPRKPEASGEWLQVRGWSRHEDDAPIEIRKAGETGSGYSWAWYRATEPEKKVMTAARSMLEALKLVYATYYSTQLLTHATVIEEAACMNAVRKALARVEAETLLHGAEAPEPAP